MAPDTPIPHPDAPPRIPGLPWLPAFLLGTILWATFVFSLINLDHTALTRWDEVHHALVAQNVSKHPFRPTLIDAPYLPYDYTKWGENHVWLHKPILPFWQIAVSFSVLGVNALALRLPSALLATAAALLTYLIGKEAFDRRVGLIAATLQAVNPFVMTLVHGYQFADHVDVALLFWVELGVYFVLRGLKSGSWRFWILAGVAQGLAFLCKSYLAGIITGMALTAWLLARVWLGSRENCRIDAARFFALLGSTALIVVPWQIYLAASYPDEFWYEELQVWRHLSSDIEHWAAPWDRVVFDYLVAMYGVFYTPILVAGIVLARKAVAERHTGLLLTYAWALGVLLPHVFAATKTPSATFIAMPAFFLLLGCLIDLAWRKQPAPLAALTGVLLMSIFLPAVIQKPGYGFPSPPVWGAVMRQSLWVVDHVGGAMLLLAILAVVRHITRDSTRVIAASRYLQVAAVIFCSGVLLWLAGESVLAAWQVTDENANDPSSVEVGAFARQELPQNAVLLCEERNGSEHLTIMFYADRTCYPLRWAKLAETARQILDAGGKPYIVSHRKLNFPAVHVSHANGPTVYQWR